jgi:hypothetical protein
MTGRCRGEKFFAPTTRTAHFSMWKYTISAWKYTFRQPYDSYCRLDDSFCQHFLIDFSQYLQKT